MTLVRILPIAIALLALSGACVRPSPTPSLPAASAVPSATGTPISPTAAPTEALSLVRNHVLSTLDYVAEVAGDLEGASTDDAAVRALQPLGGVLDDERRWFATHGAGRPEDPVRRYGFQLDTTAAAVHAVVDAGVARTSGAIMAARAAVGDLLALRPSIEALGG